MHIGSIVIRCYEFEKTVAFWQEALHYVPREPAQDDWVVLRDPSGRGPNVSLDRAAARRVGRRSRAQTTDCETCCEYRRVTELHTVLLRNDRTVSASKGFPTPAKI